MKKYAKELIKFCEKNAKSIRSESMSYQIIDMGMMDCCVLRPLGLPPSLKKQFKMKEFEEYIIASYQFRNPQDIPKALKFVKGWVKK